MSESDDIPFLGLPHGEVRLVEHDPRWIEAYLRERDLLAKILAPWATAIEHVGSTSIPGIMAKPILDISAAFRSLDDVPAAVEPLAQAGYVAMGEFGLPGRQFFVRGEPRTHHLHIVGEDSALWREHIVFRDYLRAHPEIVSEYERLKVELARTYPHDRDAYTKGKDQLIKLILRMAAS